MTSKIFIKIGIGGIIGNELLTFDFISKEKLKPVLAKILGRDPVYKLKREFINYDKTNYIKKFYEDISMEALTFKLERYVVYEYRRFPGLSKGEIEEGYFVILSDRIKELDADEAIHWCNSAKEKEAKNSNKQLDFLEEIKAFASDDIDF